MYVCMYVCMYVSATNVTDTLCLLLHPSNSMLFLANKLKEQNIVDHFHIASLSDRCLLMEHIKDELNAMKLHPNRFQVTH